MRRIYNSVTEPSLIDEIAKQFNSYQNHITDIKDMIIDQNEWYEEIFYEHFNNNNNQCNDESNLDDQESASYSFVKRKKSYSIQKSRSELKSSYDKKT